MNHRLSSRRTKRAAPVPSGRDGGRTKLINGLIQTTGFEQRLVAVPTPCGFFSRVAPTARLLRRSALGAIHLWRTRAMNPSISRLTSFGLTGCVPFAQVRVLAGPAALTSWTLPAVVDRLRPRDQSPGGGDTSTGLATPEASTASDSTTNHARQGQAGCERQWILVCVACGPGLVSRRTDPRTPPRSPRPVS